MATVGIYLIFLRLFPYLGGGGVLIIRKVGHADDTRVGSHSGGFGGFMWVDSYPRYSLGSSPR